MTEKLPTLEVTREVLGAGSVQETHTVVMPDNLKAMIESKSAQRVFRIDGKDHYEEFTLDEEWQRNATTVLNVYDDMAATGNVDMTLGGRIPLLK